ncbi:hypothetical protein QOT17_020807 [Balamuthia mandrillaris]
MPSVRQHLDNLDELEKRNRKRKQVSTVEEVNKLRGQALEAQLTLHGLYKTSKHDTSVAGKKKRLAEFVSNPSAFQHYLRHPKPQATPLHCSSPLPAALLYLPTRGSKRLFMRLQRYFV